MAVFVAGADESAFGHRGGEFFFGGFVAPEFDWSTYFANAWQERVLDTHPKLDYLHVTDLKTPSWRLEHGISEIDAERKIDEAFRVIRSQGSLVPITAYLNAEHWRSAMERGNVRMLVKTPGGMAKKRFDPDYECFLRFALTTLLYVHDDHPDAEKVDFVIEVNGPITKHIGRFHKAMPKGLRLAGRPDLAALVGDLIPGGKERVPLQAADLLVWYTRNRKTLSRPDLRRYARLAARTGFMSHMTNEHIDEMVVSLTRDSLDGSVTDDADDDEEALPAPA